MTTTLIGLFNWLVTIVTAIIVFRKCKSAYASGVDNYHKTHSQQVLTSIPGICTAWGIFFTFLSIVLCLVILYFVGDGSNFSIFNITGSIIPAFVTSLIGMWFSIKYSNSVKEIIAEDESKEIEQYGNPAFLLSKSIKDTNEISSFLNSRLELLLNQQASSQLALLNQLNDNLTSSFGNTINALNGGLSAVVEKQGEQIKIFDLLSSQLVIIKQKQDAQLDSLQQFVNSFTAEFEKFFNSAHSSFEQHMKDFTTQEVKKYTQTLTDVGNQLKVVSESILQTQKESVENIGKKVIDQLEQSNANVSDKLALYSADTEKGLKESSETITGTLNTVVENIKALSNQCNGLISTLQTQQEETTTKVLQNQQTVIETSSLSMTKAMSDYIDSMKKSLETVQGNVTASLQSSADSTSQAIDSLTAEVKEKLEDLSSKITETSVEPLKVLKAEIEFVTERVGQICSNYQQAQVAYSDALKNAHNSNETWEKALQSNKKALETIEQTNIHVTEVLDAVSQRDEGLKQIRDEISNISETISQLQELNSILTKISSK